MSVLKINFILECKNSPRGKLWCIVYFEVQSKMNFEKSGTLFVGIILVTWTVLNTVSVKTILSGLVMMMMLVMVKQKYKNNLKIKWNI